MANYAIMRVEKRKLSSVGRICKHHERLKTEYKSNPDIDPERTGMNYHREWVRPVPLFVLADVHCDGDGPEPAGKCPAIAALECSH